MLIPRNTPLPAKAKGSFKTQKSGQASILIQIVEGESANPKDCCQVGRCLVRDLPPNLPARTPVIVEFEYQENGRLQVSVAVGAGKSKVAHELVRDNSLTQQQLTNGANGIARGDWSEADGTPQGTA